MIGSLSILSCALAITSTTQPPVQHLRPGQTSRRLLAQSSAGGRVETASRQYRDPCIVSEGEPPSECAAIHRGVFYFSFGLGAGASNLADASFGGSGAGLLVMRSGFVLFDRFLFGVSGVLVGQWNRWAASEHAGSGSTSVLGEMTYFPLPAHGLNFSTGVGWGWAIKVARNVDTPAGLPDVDVQTDEGPAYMAALGYDLFASEGFNLGLQMRYDGLALRELGTVSSGSLNLMFNFY